MTRSHSQRHPTHVPEHYPEHSVRDDPGASNYPELKYPDWIRQDTGEIVAVFGEEESMTTGWLIFLGSVQKLIPILLEGIC